MARLLRVFLRDILQTNILIKKVVGFPTTFLLFVIYITADFLPDTLLKTPY